MRTAFVQGALFSVLLTLAGCSTAQNSIFRSFDLDNGGSLATDARQRVIINTPTHPTSRPGHVNPERIVCAEPSPDVATIVANSFGFGLNVLGKGNTALSGTQSEAMAQLAERTVTVQLLRDQMYRACEAYANGAISGTEYSLLMSRNNDAMVTLMLGEAASRTVGRQLAALTSEGNASANASMSPLEEAANNVIDTTEEANNANDAADQAAENSATADSAMAGQGSDASDAAQEQAQENANEAEAEQQQAEGAKKEARENQQEAIEQLKLAIATSASSKTQAQQGGFSSPVSIGDNAVVGLAEQLATMQKEYLNQGTEEHFISACVVEMGRISKPAIPFEKENQPNDTLAFATRERTYEEVLIGDFIKRAMNAPEKYLDDFLKNLSTKRIMTDRDVNLFELLKQLNDLKQNHPKIYNDFVKTMNGIGKMSSAAGSASDFVKTVVDQLKDAFTTKEKFKSLIKSRDDIEEYGKISESVVRSIATQYYEVRRALQFGYPEKGAAYLFETAAEAEQGSWSQFWNKKSDITDRMLKTHVALEDRERMSLLADTCRKHLDNLIGQEQKRNAERERLQAVLDILVELEKVRTSVRAGGNRQPGGVQSPQKPDNKNKPVSEIIATYVRCDKRTSEEDKELCRIEALGALIEGTEVSASTSGGDQNQNRAIDPKSGTHVIQLASGKNKAALEKAYEAIKKQHSALLKDKAKYYVESGTGAAKTYGLRIGPYKSNAEAGKFCTDSKRPANDCSVVKL